MLTSRVSAKGQITIPKEIRDELGLGPGDLVEYRVREGEAVLRRVEPFDPARHAALSQTMDEWETAEDDEAFGDL
ncbi:MAG: AbrB/MazE/SpoVT family DNA-binding domain-containing protein [Candidatus Latescibacterota bacterium]